MWKVSPWQTKLTSLSTWSKCSIANSQTTYLLAIIYSASKMSRPLNLTWRAPFVLLTTSSQIVLVDNTLILFLSNAQAVHRVVPLVTQTQIVILVLWQVCKLIHFRDFANVQLNNITLIKMAAQDVGNAWTNAELAKTSTNVWPTRTVQIVYRQWIQLLSNVSSFAIMVLFRMAATLVLIKTVSSVTGHRMARKGVLYVGMVTS